MYKREKSLILKGSASALANNLSVTVSPDKTTLSYTIVHKSVVNLVTASTDGTMVNQRQIVCKEPSATHGLTIILQCRLIQFSTRSVMVITSQRGIQMFEGDGSVMLFWYALGDVNETGTPDCFGRGICGVADTSVCVGNHKGNILVLHVPSKGTNITLSETLRGSNSAICDLNCEGDKMVSGDDLGSIVVWKAGEPFQRLLKINGPGYPCSSVVLWRELVVAGYSSGHLRVFCAVTGTLRAEVAAHARWITAVDIAKQSGLVISAAEDAFFHVWQLTAGSSPLIEHVFAGNLDDVQIQGAKFISDDGRALAITGYDSHELFFYRQTR